MSIATWEFESPPLHHQFSFIEKSSVRAQPCLKYEGDNLGKEYFAEIAQLVEHNLAKVGVAGPSPVFRSSFEASFLEAFLVYRRLILLAHELIPKIF